MKTKDYESYVLERCQPYVDEAYLVVAINEEAGEIAGWYKKFVLRENPTGKFSEEDLKGELGDVLFYLTRMASLHGWTLSDVMDHNRAKLDDRVARNMKSVC